MRKTILLLLCACAQGCPAEPTVPPANVDELVRQQVGALVDQRTIIGAAVGVVTPEGQRTWYLGRSDKDKDAPPAPDTLFEIGSITKVFTGTMLAAMQLEGVIDMYAPLQQYLPEGVHAPTFEGKPVTVRDLATQNSGLPRLPDNFGHDADPYARYDEQKLYEFLNAHQLRRAPGAEYEYSNLGVGLLGHVLALRVGKDYEALVTERICGPLGMADTVVHTRAEQVERVAQGYSLTLDLLGVKLHTKEAPWTWNVLAGCGALRSTLPDMMKFLAAAMGGESPLKEAFALAQENIFAIAPNAHVGLNWHISVYGEKGERLVWHNGGTGGYHAFLGFRPDTGVGVVVLSNSSADEIDTAAVAVVNGAAGLALE